MICPPLVIASFCSWKHARWCLKGGSGCFLRGWFNTDVKNSFLEWLMTVSARFGISFQSNWWTTFVGFYFSSGVWEFFLGLPVGTCSLTSLDWLTYQISSGLALWIHSRWSWLNLFLIDSLLVICFDRFWVTNWFHLSYGVLWGFGNISSFTEFLRESNLFQGLLKQSSTISCSAEGPSIFVFALSNFIGVVCIGQVIFVFAGPGRKRR